MAWFTSSMNDANAAEGTMLAASVAAKTTFVARRGRAATRGSLRERLALAAPLSFGCELFSIPLPFLAISTLGLLPLEKLGTAFRLTVSFLIVFDKPSAACRLSSATSYIWVTLSAPSHCNPSLTFKLSICFLFKLVHENFIKLAAGNCYGVLTQDLTIGILLRLLTEVDCILAK